MNRDNRRAPRKTIGGIIPVRNALTDASMGRIGNLSRTGLMLISPLVPHDNALYQLIFEFPSPTNHVQRIEVGVQALWCSEASTPGQYWAGFRFISIAADDAKTINGWMSRPDFAAL